MFRSFFYGMIYLLTLKINLPHAPSLHQAVAFDDTLGDFYTKLAQGVAQILKNDVRPFCWTV